VLDAVAIAGAAAVTVILVLIAIRVAHGDSVYWFAGFRPSHGVAIGIDFDAGTLSAGLAVLAALLVTARAQASDSWPGALSYSFDFGDGSSPVVTKDPSAQHSYPAKGSYQVSVEQAPTDPKIYDHGTGGSGSGAGSWLPLRQAGAEKSIV